MLAIKKYAELTMKAPADVATFGYVADQYFLQVVPTKAARSQDDNRKELVHLLAFFDNPPAPLDLIEPVHIRQYLDWRAGKAKSDAIAKNNERIQKGRPPLPVPANLGQVRANREISLFSHIWNFAREYGYTKQQNPCLGVRKFKEKGRVDVYVSDDMLNRVLDCSDKQTGFTLKLAYLTGQRPADVLKMNQSSIRDGFLHIRQGKTDAKLRIEVIGELAVLLDEMAQYKASIGATHDRLLVNEKGQPLTYETFRSRFDKARAAAKVDKKDFQLRDMRAKAATQVDDMHGIRSAQKLLGHTTEAMTDHYVRGTVGAKVKPVK